jgi:hypothetical protein
VADTDHLQNVSTQLMTEGNINALYEQILEAAIALMRADMGSLQMLSSNKAELQLLAWKGFDPASAAFWNTVGVDSQSTCGKALRTHKRVIVSDVDTYDSAAAAADLASYRRSGIRAASKRSTMHHRRFKPRMHFDHRWCCVTLACPAQTVTS